MNLPHGTVLNATLPTKIFQGLDRALNDMVIFTSIILYTPPNETLNLSHLALQGGGYIRRLQIRVRPIIRAIILRLLPAVLPQMIGTVFVL